MHELLKQCAGNFRLGKDARANDLFAELMDKLAGELPRLASSLDVNRLNGILSLTFQAQSLGDYLYVADLLEYEIAPLISH